MPLSRPLLPYQHYTDGARGKGFEFTAKKRPNIQRASPRQ